MTKRSIDEPEALVPSWKANYMTSDVPAGSSPKGVLTLPDGRNVAWDEFGPSEGSPVFFMHGVPAYRSGWSGFGPMATEAGARIIIPDRPGIGLSTFQADRRILDWPADIRAMADQLRLERYWVIGCSGGGPYALACAASGDPRLVAAAVVVGIGPLDTPEAIAGLHDENREMFELAVQGVDAVVPLVEALTAAVDDSEPGALDALIASMAPEDQVVFAEHPTMLAEAMNLAPAVVQGHRGMAHDLWLLTQPWAFGLDQIELPVDFFGADHDHDVPLQHIVDQASSVVNSTVTVWPASGHTAGYARLTEVLLRLLSH